MAHAEVSNGCWGARGGGERRDGHGEQRAEAREAGSVGFMPLC